MADYCSSNFWSIIFFKVKEYKDSILTPNEYKSMKKTKKNKKKIKR